MQLTEIDITAFNEVYFPNSGRSHSEIHVQQWSQNCENSKRDALIVTDNGL